MSVDMSRAEREVSLYVVNLFGDRFASTRHREKLAVSWQSPADASVPQMSLGKICVLELFDRALTISRTTAS